MGDTESLGIFTLLWQTDILGYEYSAGSLYMHY
jgi:hypothetical protein